jgi:hypothetical protein
MRLNFNKKRFENQHEMVRTSAIINQSIKAKSSFVDAIDGGKWAGTDGVI